jgi:uncharacterized Zn finger protein
MDWTNVVCKDCGLINDYSVVEKSGQQVCNCNGCGFFLGNKPREYDYKSIKIPFGQYKDTLVSECDDMQYLNWMLNKTNPKGNLLRALKYKPGRP